MPSALAGGVIEARSHKLVRLIQSMKLRPK
jgi:hypothetical protein